MQNRAERTLRRNHLWQVHTIRYCLVAAQDIVRSTLNMVDNLWDKFRIGTDSLTPAVNIRHVLLIQEFTHSQHTTHTGRCKLCHKLLPSIRLGTENIADITFQFLSGAVRHLVQCHTIKHLVAAEVLTLGQTDMVFHRGIMGTLSAKLYRASPFALHNHTLQNRVDGGMLVFMFRRCNHSGIILWVQLLKVRLFYVPHVIDKQVEEPLALLFLLLGQLFIIVQTDWVAVLVLEARKELPYREGRRTNHNRHPVCRVSAGVSPQR